MKVPLLCWTAGVPLDDPQPLRGFFIVQPGLAEALELARRHPHARTARSWGGRIDTRIVTADCLTA